MIMILRFQLTRSFFGELCCGHMVSNSTLDLNPAMMKNKWLSWLKSGQATKVGEWELMDKEFDVSYSRTIRIEMVFEAQGGDYLALFVDNKRSGLLVFDDGQWKNSSMPSTQYLFGQQKVVQEKEVLKNTQHILETTGPNWPSIW